LVAHLLATAALWVRIQSSLKITTMCDISKRVANTLYTLLDGTNVRLNWNIESDLNVYWIKFKNFLSLY